MSLTLEIAREMDGRYLAEVPALAGVLAYGATETEAMSRVVALALRVYADRIEHGEPLSHLPMLIALRRSDW
jgi:predicted RNase H-like HicB family nuclease